MLTIQTQCRYGCRNVAAFRNILQAGTSRGRRPSTAHRRLTNDNAAWMGDADAAVTSRRYSNYRTPYRMPSTFSSLDVEGCPHRRSFSTFSTDEVVIQDPASLPPPSAPQNNTAASTPSIARAKQAPSTITETPQSASQPLRILMEDNVIEHVARNDSNDKLLIELHVAHELFHQIYSEAKSLLRNNKSSTTSDEVVAMADYFLILVNSLDLEKSLEIVQSLQTAPHENQGGRKWESNIREGGRSEVDNKLLQAVKSMSHLHHVFLTMVESSLPPKPTILSKEMVDGQSHANSSVDDVPSPDEELYSASTVGRALWLSRRAAELGMPMHRPLYQRLAAGIVLTSSPPISSIPEPRSPPPAADNATESESTEPTSAEPTSSILPEQGRQIEEGLPTPPLALDLLDIFEHARVVLQISSGDQLHRLATELLLDPFLLLLKQKRWDEAMGLLRGWGAQFGNGEKIDLLGLLGENNTFDALEIAKGWLVGGGTDFGDIAQSCPHAMELTNVLEASVSEILKGQKQRADNLSHLLWQLSLRGNDGDVFGEESDSEADFEDDFDYGSDGEEELETPTSKPTPATKDFTPPGSPEILARNDPQRETKWHDKDTVTLSFRVNDAKNPKPETDQGNDAEESTIIKGLNDKEARESIYLRNGVDWVLPDIVPTLEDWNKGDQLTFTPEFERYIGRQIMKEGKEEDEY